MPFDGVFFVVHFFQFHFLVCTRYFFGFGFVFVFLVTLFNLLLVSMLLSMNCYKISGSAMTKVRYSIVVHICMGRCIYIYIGYTYIYRERESEVCLVCAFEYTINRPSHSLNRSSICERNRLLR